MQITVVLHNIRSTYNVGAILRTAEGLGIDTVVLSGYTPRFDDQRLLPHLRTKLNRQINKSALGAETMVRQVAVDDLVSWLETKRQGQAIILGLENNLSTNEQSRQLMLSEVDKQIDGWKSTRHEKLELILILGEEVDGIPLAVREVCDYFLEIPMFGRKESFNVSVAAAIALWELKRAKTSSSPELT